MHELERLYHIHCAKGEVGRYVILPGDPGRCPSIAALFDDAHLVARNRDTPPTLARCWAKRSPSAPPASAARPPPSPWRSCISSARTPSSAPVPAAALT